MQTNVRFAVEEKVAEPEPAVITVPVITNGMKDKLRMQFTQHDYTHTGTLSQLEYFDAVRAIANHVLPAISKLSAQVIGANYRMMSGPDGIKMDPFLSVIEMLNVQAAKIPDKTPYHASKLAAAHDSKTVLANAGVPHRAYDGSGTSNTRSTLRRSVKKAGGSAVKNLSTWFGVTDTESYAEYWKKTHASSIIEERRVDPSGVLINRI